MRPKRFFFSADTVAMRLKTLYGRRFGASSDSWCAEGSDTRDGAERDAKCNLGGPKKRE